MTAKRVYFFKGTDYTRFDHTDSPLANFVLPVYPLPITPSWPGLTGPIDAAVNWGNGKVYFFSGPSYFRYDARLDAVDAGYPRPIAGAWTDAASTAFDAGVDAAVNWGNGKAYLFKGDQYIRHDIVAGTLDPGYPKPIAGNWGNVAGTIFASGIDAAINWGNGKAYWFKDDCYGRVDLATKSLDTGYPKLIAGNWPGVFTAGISGAVEWPVAAIQPANFRVPINRTGNRATPFTGGTSFDERFEMEIDFDSAPYPTTCAVGEYRQYVRGEFRKNGVLKTHLLPDWRGGPAVAMLATPPAGSVSDNFQEDGAIDTPPPTGTGTTWYGHRVTALGNGDTTDTFLPIRDTGCQYRGFDQPGWGGLTGEVISIQLDFRADGVDAASSSGVLQSSSWSVNVGGTA